MINLQKLSTLRPCIYYNQLYDEKFVMAFHGHMTVEVMYVVSGEMQFSYINNKKEIITLTLTSNQFVVIKPKLIHKFAILQNMVTRIRNIEFEAEDATDNIEQYFFGAPEIKDNDILLFEDKQNFIHSLTRLQNELIKNNDFHSYETKYIVMVAQILFDIENCNEISNTVLTGNLHLRRAMQFIQKNYQKNIDVRTISEFVGVSGTHLQTIFQQQFSMTLHQKLNQFRIEKAKWLLKNSALSIQAVAKNVGYANTQSFINNFKQFAFVTPMAYRNSQQNYFHLLRPYGQTFFDENKNIYENYTRGVCIINNDEQINFPYINTKIFSLQQESLHESLALAQTENSHVWISVTSSDEEMLYKFNEFIEKTAYRPLLLGFLIKPSNMAMLKSFNENFFDKRFMLLLDNFEIVSIDERITDLVICIDNSIDFLNKYQNFIIQQKKIYVTWFSIKITDLVQPSFAEFVQALIAGQVNFGGLVFDCDEQPRFNIQSLISPFMKSLSRESIL